MTPLELSIPKPFSAAHCTHLDGAAAGVDCQRFSLSKASQMDQQGEDSLSATDLAQHGDRLFHSIVSQFQVPSSNSLGEMLSYDTWLHVIPDTVGVVKIVSKTSGTPRSNGLGVLRYFIQG